VVNGVGYGVLSPLAGWAVVSVSVTPRALAVLAVGVCGVLAAYFAAQVFQEDEDRARGYRTRVATHGARGALLATRACLAAGFALALILVGLGWVPRVLGLCAPFYVVVHRYLGRWAQVPRGGDSAWAKGFASRLLVAGLLALGVLLAAYVSDISANRPVAGLATAAGHPPDRPLLAPAAMRRWERQHPDGVRPR